MNIILKNDLIVIKSLDFFLKKETSIGFMSCDSVTEFLPDIIFKCLFFFFVNISIDM